MPPAIALIVGLVVALLLAAGWILYLWKARRTRFETAEGLAILSAMRWRELSNLVVDALGPAGFDRETVDKQSTRGRADVVVYRDDRPWILTCRQGLGHTVSTQGVEEFVRHVRVEHAAGGLIVTPGRVDPAARQVANNVELIDGDELWRMVGPLLPPSVHAEVASRAQTRALRATAVALAVSTLTGAVLAWGLSRVPVSEPEPAGIAAAPAARPLKARPATPAPAAAAAPVAPVSEEEQRLEMVQAIKRLPGVDRALWSTRSTLQIFLNNPDVATDASICQVLKRSDMLRASRLQIEGPAGSGRPVRFMQCAVY